MFGPTVSVYKRGVDGIERKLSAKYPQHASANAKISRRLKENVGELQKLAVYVGIPASSPDDRRNIIGAAFQKMSGNAAKVKKRRQRLIEAAAEGVTNAELLFIHSKGSPARGIPPRPVLEPAIASEAGQAAIQPEMAGAIRSMLLGDKREALRHLRRAGMAGRNVARRYFFAQNGWAPLKAATIKRKGSSQPLIDTGTMRNAITFVVSDES
jgi:hypothetical protein